MLLISSDVWGPSDRVDCAEHWNLQYSVAWCLLAGPRPVHWDLLRFRLSSLIDAAAGACSRPVLLPPFRIRATGAGARWSWIPPSWLVALQQVRAIAYGALGLPGGAGRRLLPAPYALVLVARALTGGRRPVDGTRPTRPPVRRGADWHWAEQPMRLLYLQLRGSHGSHMPAERIVT